MSETKHIVNTKQHGTGQAIQYLYHYGDGKVVHLKDSIEKWLKDEVSTIKFSLWPILQYLSGVIFGKQHAVEVAKYLGTAIGILAGDDVNDARLDAFAWTIYDILQKHEAVREEKDEVKRAELIKKFEKETLHVHLENFEKIVHDNGGFFFLKITWLDIFFAGSIEVLEFYLGDKIIEGKYPHLFNLVTKISELPTIKKYIDSQKHDTQ